MLAPHAPSCAALRHSQPPTPHPWRTPTYARAYASDSHEVLELGWGEEGARDRMGCAVAPLALGRVSVWCVRAEVTQTNVHALPHTSGSLAASTRTRKKVMLPVCADGVVGCAHAGRYARACVYCGSHDVLCHDC